MVLFLATSFSIKPKNVHVSYTLLLKYAYIDSFEFRHSISNFFIRQTVGFHVDFSQINEQIYASSCLLKLRFGSYKWCFFGGGASHRDSTWRMGDLVVSSV